MKTYKSDGECKASRCTEPGTIHVYYRKNDKKTLRDSVYCLQHYQKKFCEQGGNDVEWEKTSVDLSSFLRGQR